MKNKDFIAKILRLMTMALENNWKIKVIIRDIERVIETFHFTGDI